jgi:hypothetical protein
MTDSPSPDTASSDPIVDVILELVHERGAGKSICPSDAARCFAERRARPGDPPDLWRKYLPAARQQALALARAGRIVILRRGKPQDPNKPIKGVIRLALPPENS